MNIEVRKFETGKFSNFTFHLSLGTSLKIKMILFYTLFIVTILLLNSWSNGFAYRTPILKWKLQKTEKISLYYQKSELEEMEAIEKVSKILS